MWCVHGHLCWEHHSPGERRRTWILSRQQNSNCASGGAARLGVKWESTPMAKERMGQKQEGGEICGTSECQVFRGVTSQYPEAHRYCPPSDSDSHSRQQFLPWESSFYGISTNGFTELVKCLIPVGIMRSEASNLFRCLSRSPSSPPSSVSLNTSFIFPSTVRWLL